MLTKLVTGPYYSGSTSSTMPDLGSIQLSDSRLTPTLNSSRLSAQGLWVNGTALSTYMRPQNSFIRLPTAPFPFPKLSTLSSSTGAKSAYLFSQLNGTVFTEHHYGNTIGVWVSLNIDLGTLGVKNGSF